MRYDIADHQCLATIKSCQQNASALLKAQGDAGQAGFDAAIHGCTSESVVPTGLHLAVNDFLQAVTSMRNFADQAAAGATQAVVFYQTGDAHMAEQSALSALQATTPQELPGGGVNRSIPGVPGASLA